ncbi:MAG: hypothetical protein ABSG68_12610 [Thermoguttaceae bacterium]|jgi:hypothetical protein
MRLFPIFLAVVLCGAAASARAEVCNIKVLTDATPDYTDMPSMIRSITGKWSTPAEKCWAVWYWNHLGRRQTIPMSLHGLDVSDPIRQFNDYGYTMCSTVAGINCATWYNMGLKVKYWDVHSHTVPEVFFDDRYHMYDDSMSAIYTLCDGKTIAGVEDIGKEGACAASGGKKEMGHIAKYHCLTATSPNGWLTGADCARSLQGEAGCFFPKGIAYRYYYNDWDWGHRYVLNLRPGEIYTRSYKRLDGYDANCIHDAKLYKSDPRYYVANRNVEGAVKDPEIVNQRFFIRGNGTWVYRPPLSAEGLRDAYRCDNITAAQGCLQPARPGLPGELIYKIQSANVATGQTIAAGFFRKSAETDARIAVSTSNGLHWTEVWRAGGTGRVAAKISLGSEVNGAYEILVRIRLEAKAAAADIRLEDLEIRTITQINSKTQPKLTLGENTIYVGAGEQSETLVFWPDLQGDRYRQLIVGEENIKTKPAHQQWNAVLEPRDPARDAYLVYKLETPGDVLRIVYGGRFYNRDPQGSAELLYSTDDGKNWQSAWKAANPQSTPPWDLMHYQNVDLRPGTRSVLVKYLLRKWGLYALRAEADYAPADAAFRPLEVTFRWTERNGDVWGKGLVPRSHTQLLDHLPARYAIHVGGDDLPDVASLEVRLQGAVPNVKYGYADGRDAGGPKFLGQRMTSGRNLAQGKTYRVSCPSVTDYNAAPFDGKTLTDGIVGPCSLWSWSAGNLWKPNTNPAITLDLGGPARCAAFGLNFLDMGDLLKDNLAVRTKIKVLVSADGKDYRPLGWIDTRLHFKDVPVNYMLPDDEMFGAYSFYLRPDSPVTTRYVRYEVTSPSFFCCTELLVPETLKYEPFDLRLKLPDEQ